MPELVPDPGVQRVQDERQEIPVRRECHLRHGMTRHDGLHDAESAGLSPDVRLSPSEMMSSPPPNMQLRPASTA